jgi:hypothetical protein
MQAIIKNSNGSVESVSIILKDYYYYDGAIIILVDIMFLEHINFI